MAKTHRILPNQIPQILKWIKSSGGVAVWHPPGKSTGDCWYSGSDEQAPDPRADFLPTEMISLHDFDVVVEHVEVFRKTLPAVVRPGFVLSDAGIEKVIAKFEAEHDLKTKYDEEGSYFNIEPNKKKPWLYDGVVYAVKRVVPLKDWPAGIVSKP